MGQWELCTWSWDMLEGLATKLSNTFFGAERVQLRLSDILTNKNVIRTVHYHSWTLASTVQKRYHYMVAAVCMDSQPKRYRFTAICQRVFESATVKATKKRPTRIAKPSILSFQHGGRRHIPTGLLHDRRIVGRLRRIVSWLVTGDRTGREIWGASCNIEVVHRRRCLEDIRQVCFNREKDRNKMTPWEAAPMSGSNLKKLHCILF